MIEIAKIPIINENSIAEARNKIILLSQDLKFDSYQTNKLATFTSEFSRICYQNNGKTNIIVGFSEYKNLFRLKLIFDSINDDSTLSKAKIFFDEVVITDDIKGLKKIEALKYIPNPYFIPNEEFLDREKERLARLSRSELLSDIKRKNAELLKLLDEKEMMVKEIHHRVKNNLMIISSLLNLQSSYIKDKASKDIFKESQNRARSMALIHERLYQSTDLKRIDFGDYITSLATELFHTYVVDPSLIELKINVDDIFLDINTAIPLGLIVNELTTNSLKYAFPDGKRGKIIIDFHPIDEHYEFTLKDNGIGFPEDLNFHDTDTLGLQIVNSLTDQIDGEITLDKNNGTEFKITFKELAYKEG